MLRRCRVLALAVGCAAALGASAASAADPQPATSSVRIRGTVRDANDQRLAGATVKVLSDGNVVAQALTDAEGRFEAALPAGSYTVRASKVGFEDGAVDVDATPSAGPLMMKLARRPLEVEVQGTRAPAPSRNAASESIVTRAMLDALPGGNNQGLVDVLNTQPGFVTDSYGTIHARTNDGLVGYVIDGVPILTFPLGQFQAFIPMRLVSQMKITTGGFPAEYGISNGAVIDITTRRPEAAPSGQVEVTYGSYQLISPAFDYAQQLGKLGVLVGGSITSTQRGQNTPAASPIVHDDMLSGKAFARLDYRFDGHDHLELLGAYVQTHYQIPIDTTVPPPGAAPPGGSLGLDSYGNSAPPYVPPNANPTETERSFFATLAYIHTASNGDALHAAPYVWQAYGSYLCDPQDTLGPTAAPGSTCGDDMHNAVHEGAVVDYSWKVGEHHRLKAGGLFDFAEVNDSYASYTRHGTTTQGGPDPSQTISGADQSRQMLGGVYLQDAITLGRWTILPGVRADVQQTTYLGVSEPSLTLAGPSARLGVSYAPAEDVVLRAFVGRLWQPPPSTDAPVAARILTPQQFAGKPVPVDLKAETDWVAEVGYAQRFAQQVTGGLTAYGRLSQDLLDRQLIGNTDLYESYNWARGRAAGIEAWTVVKLRRWVDGFANAGLQIGQGQGTDSAKYLFTPSELAFTGWSTLDHVQTWTVNASVDVHDERRTTHLAALVKYGSGMRTGPTDTLHVPSHATLDLSLRHRFDFWSHVHPEVAFDVYNVFNTVYALRLANGDLGASEYGALRHADVRLTVPFGL